MTGATDVRIEVTPVVAEVVTGGLEVSVMRGGITTAVVGLPGARGPQGETGPRGEPGTGLPAGGARGQVPVKLGPEEFTIGWSASFVIDPATGWTGAGTDEPKSPLHVRGNARALVLENGNAAGKRWAICPGHPGNYDQQLILAYGDSIGDVATHALRIQADQPLTLPNGAVAADGKVFGSVSSSGLAFYQPFDGAIGRINFRGAANSATSRLVMQGTYHDGSYHSAPVMTLRHSAGDGQRVAIGDITPTTTLHVDGPIRCASYVTSGIPSASASGAGTMIYVSDAAGGARPFWSDGSKWRDAAGMELD